MAATLNPADLAALLKDLAVDVREYIQPIEAKQETLAAALDHFAGIVERVPDLERRIAALEAKRHAG